MAARDSLAETANGEFKRTPSTFRDSIGSAAFPAARGRYVLYVSYACPWASRCLALITLKGLEDVIEVSVVAPIWEATKPGVDEHRGWVFSEFPGATPDPVFGAKTLREVYERSANGAGANKFTVPVLLDKESRSIVNNESSEIVRMFNAEFNAFAKHPEVDLYPAPLRAEIDALNDRMYNSINNGVYRCGFAQKQEAYEVAFKELFAALDHFDDHLASRRYLCGPTLTEADVRLFVTLVRFDEVYVVHFKTNRTLIREFRHLHGWLRDVYQYAGGAVGRTVNMEHIKNHYYGSHTKLNPYGIVPLGAPEDFTLPHGREAVGAASASAAAAGGAGAS